MLYTIFTVYNDYNLQFCILLFVVVNEEEHSHDEEVKGGTLGASNSDGTVLSAVLLLLSGLRRDELNTVKDKVQQMLSQ